MTTTTTGTVKPVSKGMLNDIIDSIFTPGTNSNLINAMNYSFYGLFLTLFGMLYLTNANIHICAMLVLSIGLFISIKWYVNSTLLLQFKRSRKEADVIFFWLI